MEQLSKMKRKEVWKLVETAGEIAVSEVQAHFDARSRSRRKMLNRLIADFAAEGLVTIDPDTRMIRVIERKKKGAFRGPAAVAPGVTGQAGTGGKKSVVHNRGGDRGGRREKEILPMDDFEKIIEKHKIRVEFPSSVMREAESAEEEIPQAEIARRQDLRNRLIVTIDGADAKDLDDAVSVERSGDGWKLGVHIADVSYYVPKGSKLDGEAVKRGNSFYFINKVVPMFPKILSNGICSLNPQEDRLTLSVHMTIGPDGGVKEYEIRESVIHTRYRLTYDHVQNLLDGKTATEDRELMDTLREMHALFRVLNARRIRDGSIDFNFREQKCSLDENDEPVKLWLKDRQDSERIIEEFMLIANQTVAKFLSGKGVSIYRIHGEPESEKLQAFTRLVLRLGHKVRGLPVPDAQEMQRILKEVEDKPHKELVNQILLRSMQQARYDTSNIGHFGLGFEYYTHYTSPIRRYADLVVHRLIKNFLSGREQGRAERTQYFEQELNRIADHISAQERVAMVAERDFYKIKAIRFMRGREGQVYDGLITGVTDFGIFTQIRVFGVEGLTRFQDLPDDYYEFDMANYRAVGRKTKKSYTMGDPVKVRVKRVNVARGFMDLLILSEGDDEIQNYLKTH